MQPLTVSLSLVAALVASQAVKFWLAGRQARSVRLHRDAVPPPFARTIARYVLGQLRELGKIK